MCPIKNSLKQGDALSPLLLKYAVRRVLVNQDGLKLNGAHQLLVYTDDANTMEGSEHSIKKKNTEPLVFASKQTGLQVNADKIKYMVMF